MKLGILICDQVSDALRSDFGDYPDMFHHLFAKVDESIELSFFDVTKNHYPESLNSCDGYLTSGSRRSVYEEVDWLPALSDFIIKLYNANIPLVGICFGHQLIAQIFGGKVERSEKGWGIGISNSKVDFYKEWMEPKVNSFNLLVSHQDQVSELPKNATVLASNDFCPNAMLQFGDRFMSVQGHPEFYKEYAIGLMDFRKDLIPADVITNAKHSFELQSDDTVVTQWIINFINKCK